MFINYDAKIANEKEFLKKIIAPMQQNNKKVCLERPILVKDNHHTVTRYVAYNGN